MTDKISIEPDGLTRSPWAMSDPLLATYYDTEWGMPVCDEQGLFERLSLEAFQSGLSWLTILRRRPAFRAAFADFDPDAVAAFTAADIERLCQDDSIIRNRMKITATVANARATVELRQNGQYADLAELVWSFMPDRSPACTAAAELPTSSPESVALAKELKRHGFTFVGPITVYAMMGAIGMVDLHVVGSHRRGCSGLWNEDGSRAGVPEVQATPGKSR